MFTPASAIFLGMVIGIFLAYVVIKKNIDLPIF
jgi:hypothetical protein